MPIVIPIEGESKAAACPKGYSVRWASPGDELSAAILPIAPIFVARRRCARGPQASRLLDSHISSILCDCAYVGDSGLQTQG